MLVNFKKIAIGDDTLQCGKEFCYLGDLLNASGGPDVSSSYRVGRTLKQFRELIPLLTMRGVSEVESCAESVMLYTGKREEHEKTLQI